MLLDLEHAIPTSNTPLPNVPEVIAIALSTGHLDLFRTTSKDLSIVGFDGVLQISLAAGHTFDGFHKLRGILESVVEPLAPMRAHGVSSISGKRHVAAVVVPLRRAAPHSVFVRGDDLVVADPAGGAAERFAVVLAVLFEQFYALLVRRGVFTCTPDREVHLEHPRLGPVLVLDVGKGEDSKSGLVRMSWVHLQNWMVFAL